jgi:VWFA-related protein
MPLGLAAFACFLLSGVGAMQTQAPAARLLVDVVAVDRTGNPVTDLTRDELEVRISGYRAPIEMFDVVTPSAERGGRLVVLLLDDLTLPPVMVARVKEAARRFVQRMLPGDRMAIISLNGDAAEPTADTARLRRIIEEYNTKPISAVRLDVVGEHILRTVADLSRQMAEDPAGRKTIVGLGAGWMFDRPIPPAELGVDLRSEWVAAVRTAALANASVYVIDPGGVGLAPVGGTGGFCSETGGYAFMNTNDWTGAADRVMREAGSYYLLGVIDPPIRRKADIREMEVRTTRKGVTIRARRWIGGTE